MPNRIKPLTLVTILFLAACHKDTTPPKPPVTSPVDSSKTTVPPGTVNINLKSNLPYDSSNANFELIISEPGGKVLLDTIAPANAPVKAALKTNARLFNLSVIDYQPRDTCFFVDSYNGVNPSDWVMTGPGSYLISWSTSYPPVTTAQTVVQNFPSSAIYNSTLVKSFIFNTSGYGFYNNVSYTGTTLQLGYQRYHGFYNYFAAAGMGPGLYKLYIPTSDKDTIDANHLDTLVAMNFNRAGVDPYTVELVGTLFHAIPDTTNFQTMIDLISLFTPSTFPQADLLYPREHMQKYQLWLSAYNSVNDNLRYYSYSNTVPAAPVFPALSSFSVNSMQNDNFSISFSGSKPSYCETYWKNAKVKYWLYSSPDSSTVHPLTILNSQNSKMLNGVILSDLTIKGVSFENTDGLNYAGYFSYMCNPTLTQTKRIVSASGLSRTYP
jgi:hypothetical protein